MQCGLTLQSTVLQLVWEIFLQTHDKQHLPYVVNYIMLRPDTCQEQFIHLLCDSLEYIYSFSKTQQRPRILNCLKPALMALDMKMFVIRAKESVQSLANFLATYVKNYPSFVEVLERIKILVGDVIIGKVL